MNSGFHHFAAEHAAFKTTHWTVVCTAAAGDSSQAAAALEQLCASYWYPLYAFVRRRGFSSHDAQDLVQGFFARLLEKNFLQSVNREKGRFRSFLLAALNHFLLNELDKAHTLKRGGHLAFVSFDEAGANAAFQSEPRSELSPERLFDRNWAEALLATALNQLREENIAAGKLRSFEQLKHVLTGDKNPVPYLELAASLGSTEGAVKMAVKRLRRRYAELVRMEIAKTVATPDQVEDELKSLFVALG